MRARGKAMAELHPELSERQLLASFRSDQAPNYSPYSYLSALGDYESHVWVRKAIKVIADNLSPLPLQVIRKDAVVENHAAVKLLTDVNDAMSSADLWQQWVVDMLLGGEEGWELVKDGNGQYVEIWPRQPHTLGVVPDPALRRYFRVAKYRIDDQESAPYDLPPDELVHFKFFNPRNPWRGIAPITAVRMAIVIDTYAQAWSKLFYQKSARPDYALIAPQGLGKSEREDLEKMLAAKFGSVENAHKPVVLEEGVTDIKILSFPPKDLEWVELRGISREEIGAIFGVPDEIMGWGRDTYENFETAHWVLWALTLLPLCSFRDTHLTEYFRRVKLLEPDETLVTDTAQVAALKKDLKNRIEMLGLLATHGYPINVANAYLGLGLPDIDGGDVGYLPLILNPVTSAKAAARPPAPRGLARGRVKGIAEYGSIEHEARWTLFVKRTEPWENKLSDAVVELLEEQREDVIERLRSEKTVKSFKDAPTVAGDPFDREEWERKFQERVRAILRALVEDSGQNALDDISVEMAFDVDEPKVVEFLLARNQRFAQKVNETTWTQLRQSLAQGMDAGESIPQLEERVTSVMGDRIRSTPEMIARTEVVGASNGGTLEAWRQSEVVEGKAWLCVSGKFRVSGLGVSHVARRWYDGKMIELTTMTGRVLTVTAQHQVLTRRGWVVAENLHEGDDLVCDQVGVERAAPGAGMTPDIDHMPAIIMQTFDALFDVASNAGAVRRVMYLDGEGRESQIDVIAVDRDLAARLEPAYPERVRQLALELTDVRLGEFFAEGGMNSRRVAHALASNDEFSCSNAFPDCFSAFPTSTQPTGFDNGSRLDTSEPQALPDAGLRAFPPVSESLDRSALPILFGYDRCVSVKIIPSGSHVYDYTTKMGWMIANDLIVHNSALDNRTRDTHRAAHQRYQKDPIGINEDFQVGGGRGPAPGQIGLPEEDIACRCAMQAVLKTR